MCILITGAGGMIGSQMAEMIHENGDKVIGLYYKPTIDLRELNKNICLIECDDTGWKAMIPIEENISDMIRYWRSKRASESKDREVLK